MIKAIFAVAISIIMSGIAVTQLNLTGATADSHPISSPITYPITYPHVCQPYPRPYCVVGTHLEKEIDSSGCSIYRCVPNHPIFNSTADASPNQVLVGQTTEIEATVWTSRAVNALVDVEIYDALNHKVGQKFYDDQHLIPGRHNYVYMFPWKVPASAIGGEYTIKVGIFGDDWHRLYSWNNHAGSFLVMMPVPPSVTPTPTPTPTPSVTPTVTPTPAPTNDSVPAPTCNDTKPGSAPTLLSAKVTGNNEVTLQWSQPTDPVSYYLIAYGYDSNQMLFGDPNVGGKGTTSFRVQGLSGNTTYYFKVRAGNGCMPGDFSNGLSVTVPGPKLITPAANFQSDVLGDSTQNSDTLNVEASPSPSDNNSSLLVTPHDDSTSKAPVEEANIFIRLWHFITHFFGR